MQNKYWANEQWNNLAPEVTLESIGASPEVLKGTIAPTTNTAGAVGQFYLDTVAKELYQCTTQGPVYTWKSVSKEWKLLQTYTTSGSYTFTTPSGISELGAFIIGGGGSGAAGAQYNGTQMIFSCGGASGRTKSTRISGTLASTYPVVVGAGGTAKTAQDTTSDSNAVDSYGTNGGSSSFNGIVAVGGEGGLAAISSPATNGATGAQGSSNYNTKRSFAPAFGELRIEPTASVNFLSQTFPNECVDPFSNKKLGIAGGYAYSDYTVGTKAMEDGASIIDDYGNHGSSGIAVVVSDNTAQATAIKGTSYGCGGGGATARYNGTATATSAAGCDGAVLIYGR